jgi:hypothetical protein
MCLLATAPRPTALSSRCSRSSFPEIPEPGLFSRFPIRCFRACSCHADHRARPHGESAREPLPGTCHIDNSENQPGRVRHRSRPHPASTRPSSRPATSRTLTRSARPSRSAAQHTLTVQIRVCKENTGTEHTAAACCRAAPAAAGAPVVCAGESTARDTHALATSGARQHALRGTRLAFAAARPPQNRAPSPITISRPLSSPPARPPHLAALGGAPFRHCVRGALASSLAENRYFIRAKVRGGTF